jgi:hypothetical protein
MGMALVFARLADAVAEEAFAWVEANAPVRARAMTTARMMIFMVLLLPFWLLRVGEAEYFSGLAR